MTNEEAKKHINAYVIMECDNMPFQVIQALDVFREANEKQIPKKPKEEMISGIGPDFFCPSCYEYEGHKEWKNRLAYDQGYCDCCGQKIDWSEYT